VQEWLKKDGSSYSVAILSEGGRDAELVALHRMLQCLIDTQEAFLTSIKEDEDLLRSLPPFADDDPTSTTGRLRAALTYRVAGKSMIQAQAQMIEAIITLLQSNIAVTSQVVEADRILSLLNQDDKDLLVQNFHRMSATIK